MTSKATLIYYIVAAGAAGGKSGGPGHGDG
jgi:hypothetical protein